MIIDVVKPAADKSFHAGFIKLPARGGVVVAANAVHLDLLGTSTKGDTLVLAGIIDSLAENDADTSFIFFNEYLYDGWTPHWHGWFPFADSHEQEAYIAIATSLANQIIRLNMMVVPND
jgi:hypothetical protein